MTDSLFERFTSTATMMEAEFELLALKEGAVPILESFLSGEAKDRSGAPWRERGLPLRCALEVARRLGPVAKRLEPYLREQLKAGHSVAAMALRSLQTLEEASIAQLAESLGNTDDIDLPYESAAALIDCGYSDHPLVVAARSRSEKTTWDFAGVATFLARERSGENRERAQSKRTEASVFYWIMTLHSERDEDLRAWAEEQLVKLDDNDLGLLLRPVSDKTYWKGAAQALKRIGYPRVRGILPGLLEWLRDMDWQGADNILELLLSVDDETLIAHLKDALRKAGDDNDDRWAYWLRELVRAKGIERAFSAPEWQAIWKLADRKT